MKDAVIAKLANQAADFYGDAFKQCQYKDNLPKVYEEHTHTKLHINHEMESHTSTVSHVLGGVQTCRAWTLNALECVWLCVLFCVYVGNILGLWDCPIHTLSVVIFLFPSCFHCDWLINTQLHIDLCSFWLVSLRLIKDILK